MKDVSDSISVFNGKYPGGGNVTSVVYHAGRDAFVFDSLLSPDDTYSLLQSMTRLGLKARGLINTHWHIDHTAGNQLFLDTHRIISHSLCGHLMRTEGRDDPGWANGRLKLDGKDRSGGRTRTKRQPTDQPCSWGVRRWRSSMPQGIPPIP